MLKDGRFFWLEWLTPSSFTSAHFVEDSPAPVSDDYCPVLRYDQGDGKFHADYRLCDTDKAAAVCYLYPDSVGGSSPGQGGGGCGAAAEAEGEGSSPPLVDRWEYFIELCRDWEIFLRLYFSQGDQRRARQGEGAVQVHVGGEEEIQGTVPGAGHVKVRISYCTIYIFVFCTLDFNNLFKRPFFYLI